MKRITLLAFGFLFSFQLMAQSKVGTIDVDYILSKMPELNEVNTNMNAYGKDLESQLGTKMTAYQGLVKDYQDNEINFTIAMKKTKQDEIIAAEGEIQKYQQNSGQLIQIKQNELLQPLYLKIGKTLEAISKELGYTQVFTVNNTIAYLDPNHDLTTPVLKRMGLPTE